MEIMVIEIQMLKYPGNSVIRAMKARDMFRRYGVVYLLPYITKNQNN